MNRGSAELGRFVREFRVAKGLTQRELAMSVGCSRSAIALMEQGRRLLDASTLVSVSKILGLPSSIVAPFLSPVIQARRNARAPQATALAPFAILCISGISGSGKTTLAEVVARSFGATRIGSHPIGRAYISDLTTDQDRWAFEAQVAFLVSKASEIRAHLDRDEPLVVERWIDEDMGVYERLFAEQGNITARSQRTFETVGELVRAMLPQPDYIIYCHCTADTAIARTQRRGRGDQALHSREYIEKTLALYGSWLDSVRGPEVYQLDTDRSDLAQPGVLEAVFEELQWALTHQIVAPQIPLFEDASPSPRRLTHLRPYQSHRWSPLIKTTRRSATSATPLLAPIAYLAAPFTGYDTDAPETDDSQHSLFDLPTGHGVIPRSGFRNDLLAVERALSQAGFSVLLPHRDVNEWGRKTLAPTQAMKACTEHVTKADLFVGILGRSCGAHYEFGLAHAAGKPCLLIRVDDIPSSFLAHGTPSLVSPDVLELSSSNLRDAVAQSQSNPTVRDFLLRHFGTSPQGR